MAGDWIKMRSNLWDDPRVARLCDLTDAGEAAVIGGLYWLWSTADQHSEDGLMPGLTVRSIDRKTGVQGLGSALVSIGWLSDNADGVCLERFDEHNGASAKARAQTARRVANHKGNAKVTQTALPEEHDAVTDALAREREEKEKNKNIGPNGGGELLASLPVDNSSPLAAADISKNLTAWETARGKAPKPLLATDLKLVELTGKGITIADLRTAYDLAVAARVKAADAMPVNPGFVSSFVDEIRASPTPQPSMPNEWYRTASGIERKAKELGINPIPFEPMPALSLRVKAALEQLEHAV